MENIIFISIFVSFFIALFVIPSWIKKCIKLDLLWEDMNKKDHPRSVAASGGVVVIMAFILGVLYYIAINTFIIKSETNILQIFSLLAVILILSIVGLVDDMLGWKHGGLSAKLRVFLALMASIPLVVINAGYHIVNLPFIGQTDLGTYYPLLFIPIGIIGASTTYNMLAGFNGLEAGQGIIILSFLSYVSYLTNKPWLAVIGLCMVASLLAFYIFNRHPAKVFPGDIMTYSVGALIACMAILGNFEKIAVFVFLPYGLETLLKLRGKLKKQSFGKPQADGSLDMPYDKIYGLTHLTIFILKKFKKKVYEKDVVYFILTFEIILCLLALFIFKKGLIG